MVVFLFTVVPVGLALGLLVFGRYGGRRPVPPTPGRIIPLAIISVLLGPVALSVLGLFGWLVLLVVIVAAVVAFTMLRSPSRPLRG